MYQWGIQVGQWCHPDPAVALPASFSRAILQTIPWFCNDRPQKRNRPSSFPWIPNILHTPVIKHGNEKIHENPWKSSKKVEVLLGSSSMGDSPMPPWRVNEICFNSPSIFRKSRIHCVLLDVCATWTPGARSFLPGWKANIKRNHAIPSLPEASLNQAGLI